MKPERLTVREANDASGMLLHRLPDFVLVGDGLVTLKENEDWEKPASWDRDLTDLWVGMDVEMSEAPKDIDEDDECWYRPMLSEDGKVVEVYPVDTATLPVYRLVRVEGKHRKAFLDAVAGANLADAFPSVMIQRQGSDAERETPPEWWVCEHLGNGARVLGTGNTPSEAVEDALIQTGAAK
jgi:hypothetical protein